MAKRRIVKKVNLSPQLDLLSEIEKQSYTTEQKQFIDFSEDKSVILAATAGSGKTYSCVQRLKELLSRGVDPKRIIFFSFTKAATEELQERVGNKDVRITTIHAFCYNVLATSGKFKNLVTFHDFINWFKEKYKPAYNSNKDIKQDFYNIVSNMYEESDFLSSSISAFKLQSADNIKCRVPDYITEYNAFLREKKSRDFSDILIEVREMFKEEKWLRMFRSKFDYIFVDEYQDTSPIQLEILLSLNAKYYYLIGDRNQSIFGFSGSNCKRLEEMLEGRRSVTKLNLSINFRSDKNIVENSNKFSSLKAVANSKLDGYVDDKLMLSIDELIEILKFPEEVVVLVRTNDVIKKLEQSMLKRKIPMRYFNFITPTDIENFNKGKVDGILKIKFEKLKNYFENEIDIINFIETNKNSNKFITSIHKSKGREFHTCVVVNSVALELLQKNPNFHKLSKKQLEKITFDPDDEVNIEPRNIHYVAVSRSKKSLYFLVLGF